MNDKLPKGWELKTLEEICKEKPQSGGTPLSTNPEFYNGEIPWAITEDLTNARMYIKETMKKITKKGLENSSARWFPAGTILFAMYGSVGRMSITKIPMTTNQAILGIQPDENKVKTKFLYYYLDFVKNKILSKARGGTQPNVNAKILKEYKILVPPLPIQEKIVAKLDAFFEKYEGMKKENEKTKEKTGAFLQHAISELLPQKELEEGRAIKSLREVCEKPEYGYTANSSNEKIGPRYVRITDFSNRGELSKENKVYINKDVPKKFYLREKDVLIARTGATAGHSLFFEETEDAVFASYLIRFRAKEILPELLYFFTKSTSYWKQLKEKELGTAQPNVNATKLGQIKISFPVKKEDQRATVKKIELLQQNLAKVKETQKIIDRHLDLLPKAVLAKAFSGELVS